MMKAKRVRVGVVQMDSRDDVAANLEQATDLIVQAAHKRAQFVALPECALYIGPDTHRSFSLHSREVRTLARLAQAYRIWLLVGSIHEPIPGGRLRYNTSLLYGPDGRLKARYRKIHLFRCRMPSGNWLHENGTRAAAKTVVANTNFGKVGMTICYDLRMPELFGRLSRRGAELLCVPANFTAFTGRDHWHPLLRSRAIENQAFVIAPAQCGEKYNVKSYGHAVIVDPWGEIIAEGNGSRPGILCETIDLRRVDHYRERLPALHDRFTALKRMK